MRESPVNPYESPKSSPASSSESSDLLPEKAVKKARNLVRDARLAIVVALMPPLGLVFIIRIAEWYVLRTQFPVLAVGDAGEHGELAAEFRAARNRLWFAALLWPVAILAIYIYGIANPR
jgi:hypothetical protein